MARNKYPEETIKKILDVSQRLFMEKGYEHTSLQDIIDELGGLTKGAIYHHFKSKEDILLAVMDRIYKDHDAGWDNIMADNSMNGLQKLQRMFHESIFSPSQIEMFKTAPDFIKNPKMLALQMQGVYDDAAPDYIEPIIRMGVEDGSIKTKHPLQLAEMMLVLSNLWLSPMVSSVDPEQLYKRFEVFSDTMRAIGLDIFTQEMLERLKQITELYIKNK